MSSDNVKNVDLKQCIGTIIYSLIALCIVFVPVTFGEIGMRSAFETLPIIGDESYSLIQLTATTGFTAITQMDIKMVETIYNALTYSTYAYFIIFLLNILFSILLFITRSQIMRLIFKIISIICAFIMLFNVLMCLIHLVGVLGLFTHGIVPSDQMMSAIETTGILFVIAMLLFSAFAIKKQLKWFAKLY